MSDHTPSVNYFREFYAVESDGAISLDEARAEFDRMIEAVRAEEREKDTREPSADTGCPHEACEIDTAGNRTRCADCGDDLASVPDPESSYAEVEAAARAAYDRAFLKHAPEDVDRWDDLVVDNDEAAESWREVARAALLAAQEVRRG